MVEIQDGKVKLAQTIFKINTILCFVLKVSASLTVQNLTFWFSLNIKFSGAFCSQRVGFWIPTVLKNSKPKHNILLKAQKILFETTKWSLQKRLKLSKNNQGDPNTGPIFQYSDPACKLVMKQNKNVKYFKSWVFGDRSPSQHIGT